VKYVVAGSYEEFTHWHINALRHGDMPADELCKYVREYSQLLGARLDEIDDEVIFLPGWEELPEAAAIEGQVAIMREAAGDQTFWSPTKRRAWLERTREAILETGDPFAEPDDA
jgi:hypothetical protein